MADFLTAVLNALVRENPDHDASLSDLVQRVDTSMVVSGIGERPAISHLTKFKLNGFTSGSVCLAPALSAAMLQALKAGDIPRAESLRDKFMPLEDLRDGHSPLRVLHAAVAGAGIAETGPLLPFLSNLTDKSLLDNISRAALELVALNEAELKESGLRTTAAE